MVSKILIDTNVLIDYILEREPFFDDAMRVISSCIDGRVKGYIAAHSISNMFFILRKDFTIKERREILSNLCTIFEVEGIDKSKLRCWLFQMKNLVILKTVYKWNVQRNVE